MAWKQRVDLYQQIEEYRKRPLVVYVTSKREGAAASMANDALPNIIDQLDALPTEAKALDLLIVSYGGDPMVAWRMMTLIRQRVETVSVMIPQSAYSAATLVALGADEIIMHPNGHLGPVDMQIVTVGAAGPKRFSTEDISAFLDFVRDNLKITDQEHIRMLFETVCKEVGSLGIGFTARSSRLAVDLGERLLALHMKDDENRSKLRSIVENMSRRFQSHAYPVSRNEVIDIGLPVNKDRDEKLERLMWNVWLDVEADLKERLPFNLLTELLSSAEASKLLTPIPQLDLPMSAAAVTNFSSTIPDVKAHAAVSVNPVDFEFKTAIVESSRQAHECLTRGKILSCRTPDMVIQFNAVPTFSGWRETSKT